MPASKIMIIRHAEKPSDDGTIQGVTAAGNNDAEELVVRGWQRSGALVRFFAPVNGAFSAQGIATPDYIFASDTGHGSKSLRPQHTVLALADFLGKHLITTHLKGDEEALAKDAISQNGVVLIAWEHKSIPPIANAIMGDSTTCPQDWKGDRFDVVWIFDWIVGEQRWEFAQVPQLLLAGDKNMVLKKK